MRFVGRSLAIFAAAFLVVGLVGGQQPGQKGKGFGGGKGAALDAAALVKLDQVKKELSITDEQTEKIPAAILKGLAGVLDAKQVTRLRQIELQQKGNRALLDTGVQSELKISPEQAGNIKTILADNQKEVGELMAEAKGGGFQGIQDKITALNKETGDKLDGVLTADQRKAYKQMLGEEFKLEQKGFGGGFGGQGKGKGKKGKNKDLE